MTVLWVGLAVVLNLACVVLWRRYREASSAPALWAIGAWVALLLSGLCLSFPYGETRAFFITLGLLGLSGWLYVFARPWLKLVAGPHT